LICADPDFRLREGADQDQPPPAHGKILPGPYQVVGRVSLLRQPQDPRPAAYDRPGTISLDAEQFPVPKMENIF